ncbi:hypothetical protein AMECASPLE_012564 [Ameca splendens]|uniref:Gfo/Idh/MocA-like oxidoreductase N-terminal domain-containing protein n=1 Tax=Ameca splendens TaxID=208324 RepID=A0ABV0ZLC6_9TELE
MLPGVGVFGTSLTARVIIPLLKGEGFAVKALWGRTQEEAEELAKEMNVPFYTNRIDDVLLHQDVDLVCINLPPPLTRQIAVKTLGKSWCCGAGWMLRPCYFPHVVCSIFYANRSRDERVCVFTSESAGIRSLFVSSSVYRGSNLCLQVESRYLRSSPASVRHQM